MWPTTTYNYVSTFAHQIAQTVRTNNESIPIVQMLISYVSSNNAKTIKYSIAAKKQHNKI